MSVAVLVVDDSLVVRKQVERCLVAAGYIVLGAADGAEALERLAEHPEIRLVICDVNMPVMDGMQLLEHVSRAALPPPMVMLTTDGLPQLVARGRALGVKAWLMKPLHPELLLPLVRKIAGDPAATHLSGTTLSKSA